MELVLSGGTNYQIILEQSTEFKTDLGWEENFTQFKDETIQQLINPIINYETVRYIHEPYLGNNGLYQTDIWFTFQFLDNSGGYANGFDYSLVGIPPKDNALMLDDATHSFFRLEFYKTPNNTAPDRSNRKLSFAKNLSLPTGEKYLYGPLNQYIFLPVFKGSNYENKENMYFFWFHDDEALKGTAYTGDTFFMTARFFNAEDGTIDNFTTSGLSNGQQLIESADMYYKVVIDRTNFSYVVYHYDGVNQLGRVGKTNNPITFFQQRA
jgi:hypothetical protein